MLAFLLDSMVGEDYISLMTTKTTEEVTTWNHIGACIRKVVKSGKKPLYFISNGGDPRDLHQLCELAKVINEVIVEDDVPF